jgi:hypothetical protein
LIVPSRSSGHSTQTAPLEAFKPRAKKRQLNFNLCRWHPLQVAKINRPSSEAASDVYRGISVSAYFDMLQLCLVPGVLSVSDFLELKYGAVTVAR